MNRETARYLNAVNARFYASVHESFSATRNSSWPGWEKALPYLEALCGASDQALQVLDLACGNMRFEKFLSAETSLAFEAHCVDNCTALADLEFAGRYTECDIVTSLIDCDTALEGEVMGPETYDLGVCFGFFHHIPGIESRELLLSLLIRSLRPGGLALISLWRFMDNDKLASKASQSHALFSEQLAKQGLQLDQLEEGDYLLAWQGRDDVCRYCHHFSEAEIDGLLTCVEPQARLLARYREDGKDHRSNEYLVLQRKYFSEISS